MTAHECLDCHHQWEEALDEPSEDDWARIDLAELAAKIRSGEHKPIMPTILGVDGALPLFYPARINSLFGESGGGKTWAALAAVAEVVRRGERALLVDYEDNPAGIAERLVLLGLTDDEIALVDYRNPTTGIVLGLVALEHELRSYELVVVDSTGEAMAAGGVDSNADADVALWFALVKKLSRLPGGPAVIVLDHVPKDRDAPSSYAIGSQRKRAAVTGAAYRVDTVVEPAKGRNGKLKLTVAKDRPGNRPKGSVACELHIKSTEGGVLIEAHLSDAQAAAAAGEKFRPTVLMERVSRYLEAVPGATKNQIERAVQGKATGIRQAVEVLLADGYITLGPLGYTSTEEYRAPVDNDSSRPASPPRPTASRDAAEEGASPRPRVTKTGDAGRASEQGGRDGAAGTASPAENGKRVPVEDALPLDEKDPF